MAKGKLTSKLMVPLATRVAPSFASNFVLQAFNHAVDGTGPLRGAAAAAEAKLADAGGNADKAISRLVDSHVKLAGIQGFVTNLGGLVTMAVSVPVNISGLALLQAHLVGGIAHLRGYDLADPRVRNAVLACMLGEDAVHKMVKKRKLPSSPMAIATAPGYDAALDERIATEVAAELFTRVAGKRTMATLARRMPVIGGGFGAVTDGYGTYQIGRYTARELKSRKP